MSLEIILDIAKYLLPDIGRIADDNMKTASSHDLWKLCFPIERFDQAINYFVQLDISIHKRIATLYVVAQIWQCPLFDGPPFKRLNYRPYDI